MWDLGYPDQALKRIEEGFTLAQELSHPYSLANSLVHAAYIHLNRRDMGAFQEKVGEFYKLSNEQGFSFYLDGATIWQRMWHIDIPGILPTVIILLILTCGQMLNVGFEKVFLMQNNLNIRASEVISTYVYKIGLASATPNFSYAAAINLFKNIISFMLLIAVNRIARKVSETSLW